MANELYLYSPIFNFTAEKLCSEMDSKKGQALTVRVNSPGGSVFAGWGIIRSMKEHGAPIEMKVDGWCASMTAYMAMYADTVDALDVSQFLLHRADGEVKTEDDRKFLESVNADLRGKMEKKFNQEKFKSITGVTFDDIFNMEGRKNVLLTAAQAKEIGLVDKITRVDPKQAQAMQERFVAFYDDSQGSEPPAQGSATATPTNINNNKTIMNKQELKEKHPELFAELQKEVAAAVKAEKERVTSWLACIDVDKENVIKAIKEGTEMTQTVITEMALKVASGKKLGAIEKGSAGAISTDNTDIDKTEHQNEVSAFEKEVSNGVGRELGITNKK